MECLGLVIKNGLIEQELEQMLVRVITPTENGTGEEVLTISVYAPEIEVDI